MTFLSELNEGLALQAGRQGVKAHLAKQKMIKTHNHAHRRGWQHNYREKIEDIRLWPVPFLKFSRK
jgi:hypothetical protein